MIPNRAYAQPPVVLLRVRAFATDPEPAAAHVGGPPTIAIGPWIRRALALLAALAVVAVAFSLAQSGNAGAVVRVSDAAAEVPPVVADPLVAALLPGDEVRVLGVTRYVLRPGAVLDADALGGASLVAVERGYAEATVAAGFAMAGHTTATGTARVDEPLLPVGVPVGLEAGGWVAPGEDAAVSVRNAGEGNAVLLVVSAATLPTKL